MKTIIHCVAIALVTSLGAGCGTTPQVDSRFGEASLVLKAQQTRDPAASMRNENRPVDGMDGRAASNAIDRYHQSFALPPPPVTIINFGTGR